MGGSEFIDDFPHVSLNCCQHQERVIKTEKGQICFYRMIFLPRFATMYYATKKIV